MLHGGENFVTIFHGEDDSIVLPYMCTELLGMVGFWLLCMVRLWELSRFHGECGQQLLLGKLTEVLLVPLDERLLLMHGVVWVA